MIKYTQPVAEQMAQCRALFETCFQEDAAALDFYFNGFLTPDLCYTAQENGRVAAALYLLPAQIAAGGKACRAHYLFGAATLAPYRNQGIMQRLIGYAQACAKRRGDCFSVLLPAEESLYGYYARLGYHTAFQSQFAVFSHTQACALTARRSKVINCSFDNIAQLRFNILIDQEGSLLFGTKHVKLACDIARVYGGGVFTAESGYMFYSVQGRQVYISECICAKEDFSALFATFAQHMQAKWYSLRLPPFIKTGGTFQRFGMVKPLQNEVQKFYAQCPQAYLGLTLD